MSIPLLDWRAQALEHGHGDYLDCRLKCLSCGSIFTPREFEAAGGERQRAFQECLGRIPAVKARQHVSGNTKPCNWCTFGFIPLEGLTEVEFEDGTVQKVWPFAEENSHE